METAAKFIVWSTLIVLVWTRSATAAHIFTPRDLQVRLAFGKNAAHDMSVTWSLPHTADPSEISYWRIVSPSDRYNKPSRGVQVQKSEVVILKKTAKPFTHTARLSGLEAESGYAFFIRFDDADSTSIGTFRTGVESAMPASFLVYGDMSNDGSESTRQAVQQEVSSGNYSAVIHLGDMGKHAANSSLFSTSDLRPSLRQGQARGRVHVFDPANLIQGSVHDHTRES